MTRILNILLIPIYHIVALINFFFKLCLPNTIFIKFCEERFHSYKNEVLRYLKYLRIEEIILE